MKKIVILGATGSIGRQTLEVIKSHPEEFQVIALSARNNYEILAEESKIFKPKFLVLENQEKIPLLRKYLGSYSGEIYSGEEGLIKAAQIKEADLIVVALVGISGLKPTLAAIKARKNIALANKETLVAGGELVIKEIKKYKVSIFPIDSEHSAIWQCLREKDKPALKKIILTSSGGPFRNYNLTKLKKVNLKKALKHPTWKMGAKITIDSATLMNKGFEVLEAKWLFKVPLSKIEVIIHPQSIIHSLVEFIDGSILAQLSYPDMRIAISYALSGGGHLNNPFNKLDLLKVNLNFEKPNLKLFPCLKLAYLSGERGGSFPVVLNAANEVAVDLFLKRKIDFLEISKIINRALDKHEFIPKPNLEEILTLDRITREFCMKLYE